jgi:hypothetical protein
MLELRFSWRFVGQRGSHGTVDQFKTIVDGAGDYLLSLKDNWPALSAEVETFIALSLNHSAASLIGFLI